jgi:hypothetical protein
VASTDTLLTLNADEEVVVALLDGCDGLLLREEADPSVYWLQLRPASAPQEAFYVRLGWTQYPDAAPSIRFHSSIGGRFDLRSAWPVIPGYRIDAWDICKPFSAEGYGVHSEWTQGPHAWNSSGNPFLFVVETLQCDLDHRYGGRHQ